MDGLEKARSPRPDTAGAGTWRGTADPRQHPPLPPGRLDPLADRHPPIVPAAFRKLDAVAVLTGPSLPVPLEGARFEYGALLGHPPRLEPDGTVAARLLHDGSLDPTDQVADCLLLLYGQQLSRIAALTTGQVTRRDDAVFVRFGQHDVPIPGPLGTALQELIRDGRAHTGVVAPARTRWLFPSRLPGTH